MVLTDDSKYMRVAERLRPQAPGIDHCELRLPISCSLGSHPHQLIAGSRQIFAFSHDGRFLLSNWLYQINLRVQAPVRCVWFAAAVALLLGLLYFANLNAIGAIFSLAVIA